MQRIGWGNAARWLLLVNSAWLLGYWGRHRRYFPAIGSALMLGLAYGPLHAWLNQQLAPDYYAVLCHEQVGEGYRGDTIEQAGLAIGPYLLQSARNAQARERRHALAGLGKLDYQPGLPLLDSIARNATEPDFIRADALQALRLMTSREAQQAAQRLKQQAAQDPTVQAVVGMVDAWAAT
ncbi:hypothetical protein [Hymenobacter edaphi]|uniref:hypothetical protein n=1 Tax=Hymenobacter edaphi TaxID=2211146 RepID=UPI001057629F|nr:hypothetical protein [Hymenobacter edaphi]